MSGQFKFLENSKASLSVAKNTLFKGQIWARPSDEEVHRDEAPVDRIAAIKSESFDRR